MQKHKFAADEKISPLDFVIDIQEWFHSTILLIFFEPDYLLEMARNLNTRQ